MESWGSDGGEEEEEEDEEEAAEAAADAWLVQSLRLYRDLHSFELQAPTRVIEWAPGNRVCVAGYGDSGGNEILQLLPPPTLQVKETQDLCPERDFKVECGGFSDRPIYSLKAIPDTSLLVTSGPPDSSLQVWQVSAEDSDVIKAVSAIPAANSTGQPWAKIATMSGRAPWVLHGSNLNSIQITEVESRKNVYTGASTNNEQLSAVAFLDSNSFLLCCAQGQLCLADVRQPRLPLEASSIPSAPSGGCWAMGVQHSPPGSASTPQPVAQLSSEGHLILRDVRKTSEALAWVRCRVPSAPSSTTEFLCISWAPALENCLGVSGFDGTVHVYQQRQSWGSSGREAEPIFVHKGHVFGAGGPCPGDRPHVAPPETRTLLSAAGDGSLQVWDWVESCGERGQI